MESFLLSMEQMFMVMGICKLQSKTSLKLRSLGAMAIESMMATDMDAKTSPKDLCTLLHRRFGAKLNKESTEDGLEMVRQGDHEVIECYVNQVALLARWAEATWATTIWAFLCGVNCDRFISCMENLSLT